MTFASRPATKENLRLRNDSFQHQPATSLTLVQSSSAIVPDTQSNESHTRSDELRARSKFHLHDTRTLLLLCPMQHRYIGKTAPHTAFSCGEQVPDVTISHHRDARMQHSQSRQPALPGVTTAVAPRGVPCIPNVTKAGPSHGRHDHDRSDNCHKNVQRYPRKSFSNLQTK